MHAQARMRVYACFSLGIGVNDDEGNGGSGSGSDCSDGHTHESEGQEQTDVEPDEQNSTGDKDIYNELHFELLKYLLNGTDGTSDPTVGMDTCAAEEMTCAVQEQEQGWPVLGSKVEAYITTNCPMETAETCRFSFKARAKLVSRVRNHSEDAGILHEIAIETAGGLFDILENQSPSKMIYSYQAITEDSVGLIFSPADCDTLKRLQTWCEQKETVSYLESMASVLPSKSYFVAKCTEQSRDVALTIIIHTIEQGGSVWSSHALETFLFFADTSLLHRFLALVINVPKMSASAAS
jgi:hypothetical protein